MAPLVGTFSCASLWSESPRPCFGEIEVTTDKFKVSIPELAMDNFSQLHLIPVFLVQSQTTKAENYIFT